MYNLYYELTKGFFPDEMMDRDYAQLAAVCLPIIDRVNASKVANCESSTCNEPNEKAH